MSEAIKNELIRQMEMQADDMTPSSIQREKGLVWLEGWFDLDGLVDAVRGELNSL